MFADENKQGRYSECTPVHKEQSYVRQYNCIGFLAQAAGGLRAHLLAALSGWPLAGCMHACMFTLNLINIPNISGGAADRIKNVLLGSFHSPTARQMVCRTQAAELTSAITEACRAGTMWQKACTLVLCGTAVP